MDPIGKAEEFIDKDDNLTLAAFVYQLTAKDVQYAQQSGQWNQYSFQQKIEMLADSVGGRTIGYNPFPQVASYSPTFNLSNAINRTTLAGLALWGASEVGFLGAKWGRRGQKIATGGAIGGVFDDPVMSTPTPQGGRAYGILQPRNGLQVAGGAAPWTDGGR